MGPRNINIGPSTFLSDRKKIAFSPLGGEYSKATLPPSDIILQSRADLEIEHHLKRGEPISAAKSLDLVNFKLKDLRPPAGVSHNPS